MSPPSRRPKRPSIALSKVPSVKELCELLGFQHASLKDTIKFTDATHAWRKSHRTSDGNLASELLLWNQPSVQMHLTEMAGKFLDDGNGDRFWSPNRSWSSHQEDELEYPQDRQKIIELLKQLFWKQNRYAMNNLRYGYSSQQDRSTASETIHRETSKPTSATSLKTTTREEQPTQPIMGYSRPDGSTQNKRSDEILKDAQIDSPSLERNNPIQHDGRSTSNQHDIYEIPDDHGRDDTGTNTIASSSNRSSKHLRTNRSSIENNSRKRRKDNQNESPRRTNRRTAPHNYAQEISEQDLEETFEGGTAEAPPRTRISPHDQTSPKAKRRKNLMVTLKTSRMVQELVSERQKVQAQSACSAPVAPMTSREYRSPYPISASSRNTSPENDTPPGQSPPAQAPASASAPTPSTFTKPRTPASTTQPSQQAHDLAKSPVQQMPNRMAPSFRFERQASAPPPRTSNSFFGSSFYSTPTSMQPLPQYRPTPIVSDKPSMSAPPAPQRLETYTKIPHPMPLTTTNETANNQFEGSLVSPPTQDPNPIAISSAAPASIQPPTSASPVNISAIENTASKPRAKTQVQLWIVTRKPRPTEELWEDGKFQGTPLAAFIDGVSKVTGRSNIEKLKLTLQTPFRDTILTVHKDAEESWLTANETFLEKLKQARAEAKTRRPFEPANYKILVEPFYEQGALFSSGSDEDDEDIMF